MKASQNQFWTEPPIVSGSSIYTQILAYIVYSSIEFLIKILLHQDCFCGAEFVAAVAADAGFLVDYGDFVLLRLRGI